MAAQFSSFWNKGAGRKLQVNREGKAKFDFFEVPKLRPVCFDCRGSRGSMARVSGKGKGKEAKQMNNRLAEKPSLRKRLDFSFSREKWWYIIVNQNPMCIRVGTR